jgi:hypothetical protein
MARRPNERRSAATKRTARLAQRASAKRAQRLVIGKRTWVALLRDQAGSVMTEAVIMLPFFILVWGCIIYVSQLYEKGIETQAVARECAWRHAKDNCEGEESARCSIGPGLDVGRDYGEGDSSGIDAAESELGFLGDGFLTNLLFGRDITATATDTTRKPEVIGGGDAEIEQKMGLACNEKPRGSLGEVISDIWTELWK